MRRVTRWWHYTRGVYALRIIAASKIQRSSAGVSKHERKAVWFSCRETWEPTATLGVAINQQTNEHRYLTIREAVEIFGPLTRFEAAEGTARYTWPDHRRLGQLDPRVADALELAARDVGGNPEDWRVTYHDVPISNILCIEASEDGATWRLVGTPSPNGICLETAFSECIMAALQRDRQTADDGS